MRSCRGAGHAVFTIEEEDAILWYFRDTWNGVSLRVCAQCVVVPFVSVVFVKPSLAFFQALVGIDLVTECENDAQVRSIKPRKCILENSQTVDICSVRSRALFENETG